jgi:glycosyltransferase involved in cell wall biosynthesis
MVLFQEAVGRALRIGIYSPFFGKTVGGGEKYLGVTAEAVRDAFPQHQVDLIGAVPADREKYEQMLGLDLAGINLLSTGQSMGRLSHWANNRTSLRRLRNLYLARQAAGFTGDYDLFLTMVYVIKARSVARRTVILCQFPYELAPIMWGRKWIPRAVNGWTFLAYRALLKRLIGNEIETRAEVICQSEYVRHYVNEYWHRDAAVVNPPIDIPEHEPDWSMKANRIISVGRFFLGGHSKRQDVMVAAFKELCQAGLEGWELHLAGSVHREHPESARWYEEIQESVRGFPIVLHPDASYEEVAELYETGSIYWHAAGYEIDPGLQPAALEHFGMTTAEAMANGAVPVAINAGGQPEVVTEGVDGFLWSTLEELKARTLDLARDPELRQRLGSRARESSRRFSRASFKRRMAEQLAAAVSALEGGS